MKWLLRFGILSLIASLLFFDFIIISGPSKGYELSIYDSVGYEVWFLGICSLIFSFFAIVFSINIPQRGRYNLIIIFSLSLLIFSFTILPYLRGYISLDRHDSLTHLGILRDMINTGRISTDNIYPSSHIIVIELYFMGGFTSLDFHKIIISFFAVFLLLGSYCFGKALFHDRTIGMMSLIIGSVPNSWIISDYFAPACIVYTLVPFILFLQLRVYHDCNRRRWVAILSAFLISIVFFHPQVCILLPFIILLMPLIGWLRERKEKLTKNRNKILLDFHSASYSISLLLICFILWIGDLSFFNLTLRRFYLILSGNFEESEAARYQELLSRSNLEIFNTIIIFIYTYGICLLLIFMGLILPIIIKHFIKEKKESWLFQYLWVSNCVYLLLSIVAFFNGIIISFGRIISFSLIISGLTISAGIVVLLRTINFSFKSKTKIIIIFVILFFLISYLGIFSFYPSPNIGKYNPEVSIANSEGNLWLIQYKNDKNHVIEILGMFARYLDYWEGPNAARIRSDAIFYTNDVFPIPHFGYNESCINIGKQYSKDIYLTFDNAVINYYYNVFPKEGSFNKHDFDNLTNDVSAYKIYDNGDLRTYYIFHG